MGYRRLFWRGVVSTALVALAATGLPGCGGGSGDSSPSSSATGRVALLLTDASADDFTHIWLTVSRVELLADQSAVTVWEDAANPVTLDLLALAGHDEVFTVAESVPAGDYDKLRLHLDDVAFVPEPAEPLRLPRDTLDLNPRGTFHVEPGDTLVVELDFDLSKALHVSRGGIFRPVVFVDVLAGSADPVDPAVPVIDGRLQRLRGTVETVDAEGAGFVLALARGDVRVAVSLAEAAGVFRADPDGHLIPSALAATDAGATATAYGRLRLEAGTTPSLVAEVVEIGPEFLARPLGGTVTAIEPEAAALTLVADPDGDGQTAETPVSYGAARLFTCQGEPLASSDFEALTPPFEVRVDGIPRPSPEALEAAIVLTRVCEPPGAWAGTVETMDAEAREMTVRLEAGPLVTVRFGADAALYGLRADGELAPQVMSQLAFEHEHRNRFEVYVYGQETDGAVDATEALFETP